MRHSLFEKSDNCRPSALYRRSSAFTAFKNCRTFKLETKQKSELFQRATVFNKMLTKREVEEVRLASQGLPNKAVAGQLGLREGTVKKPAFQMGPGLY